MGDLTVTGVKNREPPCNWTCNWTCNCAFRLIEGLGGASTRRFCSPASNRAAVPAGSGRGHRAAACGSSGPAPAGSCNLCSCAAAPGMQLVLRAVDAPLRQVPC